MSDFGGRLRAAREAKGMTSYRLAQLTGLSKQGVLNLEADGADPKLRTLLKLAEALGVKPWELLPGWESPPGGGRTPSAPDGLVGLIEELEEWGRAHEFAQSPAA